MSLLQEENVTNFELMQEWYGLMAPSVMEDGGRDSTLSQSFPWLCSPCLHPAYTLSTTVSPGGLPPQLQQGDIVEPS